MAVRDRIAYRLATMCGAALVVSCASAAGGGPGSTDGANGAASPGAPDAEPAEAATDYEPLTLQWASAVGPDHWTVRGIDAWSAALEERTDGAISIDVAHAGALGPPTEQSVTIRDGVADIGEIFPVYEESRFPVSSWIANLGWNHDHRPLMSDLQSYLASIEFGLEEPLMREYTTQGIQPIIPNIQAVAATAMVCREPVSTDDDLAGLEVRVPSSVLAQEAEALAMSPTFLDATETYEALQRGIIDCALTPPRDALTWGLADVAPHMMYSGQGGFSGTIGFGAYMTRTTWQGLPTATQRLLLETSGEFVSGQLEAILDENAEAFAQMESVIEWDQDVIETLAAHQADMREQLLTSQIPDGLAPGHAEALLDRFDEIYEQWTVRLEEAGYGDWPTEYQSYLDVYRQDGVDLEPAIDAYAESVVPALSAANLS